MTTDEVKGLASECILAGRLCRSHSHWLMPRVALRHSKTRRVIWTDFVIESGPKKDHVVSGGQYIPVEELEPAHLP